MLSCQVHRSKIFGNLVLHDLSFVVGSSYHVFHLRKIEVHNILSDVLDQGCTFWVESLYDVECHWCEKRMMRVDGSLLRHYQLFH